MREDDEIGGCENRPTQGFFGPKSIMLVCETKEDFNFQFENLQDSSWRLDGTELVTHTHRDNSDTSWLCVEQRKEVATTFASQQQSSEKQTN